MISRLIPAAAFLCLSAASAAFAQTTHYVAPLGANLTGTADGSEANPWPSVNTALNDAQGGDTILLMDGSHGALEVKNRNYTSPIEIRSAVGRRAQVTHISISEISQGLAVRNLLVMPVNLSTAPSWLVLADDTTSQVIFDNLEVFGGGESSRDYLKWNISDWNAAKNGVRLEGSESQVLNSHLWGVEFGITTKGQRAQVINNIIRGFGADGMRGFGTNSTFKGNAVIDCVDISDNHDDGFQSFTSSGSIDGLILDGNTFIEWSADSSHPLRGQMQGIGLFDGFYDNMIIKNNVVAVSQYHGIAVYGGRNIEISNNTVVHNDGLGVKYPWIGVFKHKNGTPSSNVLVANNIANKMSGSTWPEYNVVYTDNSVIFDPATVFEDIANFDYHPKVGSGFVDTGNANHAPPFDIAGNARPSGNGPDRGAYEVVGSSSGGGSDGGSTDTGSGSGTSSGDGSSDGGTSGGGGGSTDGSTGDGTSGDGGETGGGSTDTGSGDGSSDGGTSDGDGTPDDGSTDGDTSGGFTDGTDEGPIVDDSNGRGNNNGGGAKWAVPPGQGKRNR